MRPQAARSHRNLARCVILAATVLGCARFNRSAPQQAADPGTPLPNRFAEDAEFVFDADRSANDDFLDDDVAVLRLRFDVERFIVPSLTLASRRTEAWNHVDELRIEPSVGALLAQNGFRVGAAGPAGHESIRTLMQGLDADVETMTHLVQSGIPLTLDLGAAGQHRNVFTINRGGTLQGQVFDGATRLIHIDYEVAIGDRPRTALRVTPEIFKENKTPYWQIRDGDVRYQKEYQGRLYRDLAIELDIAEGETLVIGPVDAADRSLMLGSIMLSDVMAGRRWETILCVTPRLFRRPGN